MGHTSFIMDNRVRYAWDPIESYWGAVGPLGRISKVSDEMAITLFQQKQQQQILQATESDFNNQVFLESKIYANEWVKGYTSTENSNPSIAGSYLEILSGTLISLYPRFQGEGVTNADITEYLKSNPQQTAELQLQFLINWNIYHGFEPINYEQAESNFTSVTEALDIVVNMPEFKTEYKMAVEYYDNNPTISYPEVGGHQNSPGREMTKDEKISHILDNDWVGQAYNAQFINWVNASDENSDAQRLPTYSSIHALIAAGFKYSDIFGKNFTQNGLVFGDDNTEFKGLLLQYYRYNYGPTLTSHSNFSAHRELYLPEIRIGKKGNGEEAEYFAITGGSVTYYASESSSERTHKEARVFKIDSSLGKRLFQPGSDVTIHEIKGIAHKGGYHERFSNGAKGIGDLQWRGFQIIERTGSLHKWYRRSMIEDLRVTVAEFKASNNDEALIHRIFGNIIPFYSIIEKSINDSSAPINTLEAFFETADLAITIGSAGAAIAGKVAAKTGLKSLIKAGTFGLKGMKRYTTIAKIVTNSLPDAIRVGGKTGISELASYVLAPLDAVKSVKGALSKLQKINSQIGIPLSPVFASARPVPVPNIMSANTPFANIIKKSPLEELSVISPHSISSLANPSKLPNVKVRDELITHFKAAKANKAQLMEELKRVSDTLRLNKAPGDTIALGMLNTEMKHQDSFANFLVKSSLKNNDGLIAGVAYKDASVATALKNYSNNAAINTEVKLEITSNNGLNFRPSIVSNVGDISALIMASNATNSSFSFKKIANASEVGQAQFKVKLQYTENYTVGGGAGGGISGSPTDSTYSFLTIRAELRPSYNRLKTLEKTVTKTELDVYLDELSAGTLNIAPVDTGIETSISDSFNINVIGFGSSNHVPGVKIKGPDGNGVAGRYGVEGQGVVGMKWSRNEGGKFKFSSSFDSQIGPNNQMFFLSPELAIANSGPENMVKFYNTPLGAKAIATSSAPHTQQIAEMTVAHSLPMTKRGNAAKAIRAVFKPKNILGTDSPILANLTPAIKASLDVGESYKIQRGAVNITLDTKLNQAGRDHVNSYIIGGQNLPLHTLQQNIEYAESILKNPDTYSEYITYIPRGTETKKVQMGHRMPVPILTRNYGVSLSYTREIDFKGLKLDGQGNLLTPATPDSPIPGTSTQATQAELAQASKQFCAVYAPSMSVIPEASKYNKVGNICHQFNVADFADTGVTPIRFGDISTISVPTNRVEEPSFFDFPKDFPIQEVNGEYTWIGPYIVDDLIPESTQF